jgi:hypothetical protein
MDTTVQTTKPFANTFGREVQLTREQFIDRWLDSTIQFGTLFGGDPSVGKYLEFRGAVAELAGKSWDKQ